MALVINIASAYPSLPSPRATMSIPTLRQSAPFTLFSDTVELSRAGRALSHAVEESSFRMARVRAVRAEIESGIYETAERIEGTVERLLDVVGQTFLPGSTQIIT